MKDVLQVATWSGSGSAARASGSGLAGMIMRNKRVGLGVGVVLLFVYLGWDALGAMTPGPMRRGPEARTAPTSSPTPLPTQAPATQSGGGFVSYSLKLDDVAGLSPSAEPGTVTDLWVMWERPLLRRPKLQRVLRGAILDRIAPPVTPDGPMVATFVIARQDVESLLWADRFGSLSATTELP